MVTILLALEVLLLLGMVITLLMMKRNQQVGRYRLDLINQISNACQEDFAHGIEEWKWRYDYFNTVSYDYMMWRPWKKLDSFYDDQSFVQPGRELIR